METLDLEVGPAQLESRSRSISSWFVYFLGKIGLYCKTGVIIWTLLTVLLVSPGVYDILLDGDTFTMLHIVNKLMISVVFALTILTPTAIYKLQKNAKEVLQDRALKLPTYVVLLFLPILKSVGNSVVILQTDKAGPLLQKIPWVFFSFMLLMLINSLMFWLVLLLQP